MLGQLLWGLTNDSVLYHSLGWIGRNRFLNHLCEMATIRSSGLPLLNAPNGIPGPWGVYRYVCPEVSSKLTSGDQYRERKPSNFVPKY
jgi:hypothetical protein